VCTSNFFEESNFFNFDQIFAKCNNIYQKRKQYDENIFHHEFFFLTEGSSAASFHHESNDTNLVT
jgi:hypothetical protein